MADSPRRALGATGLEVHPLCLGGNVFGWTVGEDAADAVLDAYVEGGGNFIDTANIYSHWGAPGNRGGESEAIIGRWLRRRGMAGRMVVATKVGMESPLQPAGLTADLVRRGAEGSLARLGVERIDLLYAHRDDPRTPVEETMGAFDALVRAGTVRCLGASQYSAPRLAAALAASDASGWARYAVLQPHYNLVERDGYEGDLEALAARTGLAVVPFFALARGFLTGKYRAGAPVPRSPRAAGVVGAHMTARGGAALAGLDRVAAAHGATPAQVALAWLMARPSVTAPIASATSPEQVTELLGAAHLRLDAEEQAGLDRLH